MTDQTSALERDQAEFKKVLETADMGTLSIVGLIVHAFDRDDQRLAHALGRLGKIGGEHDPEQSHDVSIELVVRLKDACSREEALHWGRAFVYGCQHWSKERMAELSRLAELRMAH